MDHLTIIFASITFGLVLSIWIVGSIIENQIFHSKIYTTIGCVVACLSLIPGLSGSTESIAGTLPIFFAAAGIAGLIGLKLMIVQQNSRFLFDLASLTVMIVTGLLAILFPQLNILLIPLTTIICAYLWISLKGFKLTPSIQMGVYIMILSLFMAVVFAVVGFTSLSYIVQAVYCIAVIRLLVGFLFLLMNQLQVAEQLRPEPEAAQQIEQELKENTKPVRIEKQQEEMLQVVELKLEEVKTVVEQQPIEDSKSITDPQHEVVQQSNIEPPAKPKRKRSVSASVSASKTEGKAKTTTRSRQKKDDNPAKLPNDAHIQNALQALNNVLQKDPDDLSKQESVAADSTE